MTARLFERPKSSTQSGRARAGEWVLAFERSAPKRLDPLTGWWGSGDTQEQVELVFRTPQAAQAYADRNGLDVVVEPVAPRRLKLQAYSDNFR